MRLHEYQQRCVRFLHDNPRAGLFLAMGLGKTAIVLSALREEHLPALVVAPKRVAESVWPTELEKWRPDLTFALAAGAPAKRQKAIDTRADLTIIGRDNLKDVRPSRYKTLILDELSGFKTKATTRWKLARRVAKEATYVWGMTGTPASNGLMDLWAQVFLLDFGERLGKNLTTYRSRYFYPGRQLPNGIISEWILHDGADGRIHEKISDICISLEGVELDLPPVSHNEIEVPLPADVRKQYQSMKEELALDLRDVLGPDAAYTAKNAAVLSSKLCQISAGFLYSDDLSGTFTELHGEKLKAIQEVVEGNGSPVLVFYQYRAELDRIRSALPEACQIDEPNAVERWNRGEIPVLLAHPASAGHGLNLQHGGHTIVWATAPWSLELYSQANARLARQGQINPVVVHHLIAPGTVDRAILTRLVEKKSAEQALLDHLDFTS